ncbi:MAG: hypothetical protein HOO08_04690 [Opitutae bacterium]|nr:hypothetical protein [Opitutae bacterium]
MKTSVSLRTTREPRLRSEFAITASNTVAKPLSKQSASSSLICNFNSSVVLGKIRTKKSEYDVLEAFNGQGSSTPKVPITADAIEQLSQLAEAAATLLSRSRSDPSAPSFWRHKKYLDLQTKVELPPIPNP